MSNSEGTFVCPYKDCGKIYHSEYVLRSHEKTHINPAIFTCEEEECRNVFPHKIALYRHQRTHTGVDRKACDYCGKSLCNNHALKEHIRIHTGELPYSCDVCGKRFRQASEIAYHKKSHLTKDPHDSHDPHVCQICDRTYKQRIYLTRHMLTHTREKKYKCSQRDCKSSFHTAKELRQHERSHKPLGEREKHICEICGKYYLSLQGLKIHNQSHKGEKPYKCQYSGCQKEYLHRTSLVDHYKSHMRKGEKLE